MEEAFFARSDDASYLDHEHRYRWTPFFFSLARRRVVSCAPLCFSTCFYYDDEEEDEKEWRIELYF